MLNLCRVEISVSNHGRRSGSYSATILQKCGGTVGVQILDFLALGSLRIGLVTINYLPTTLAPAVCLVNVDVTNMMLPRLSWRLDLLTPSISLRTDGPVHFFDFRTKLHILPPWSKLGVIS